MVAFTVADRTAALEFDMTSWEEIEETVGIMDDFETLMTEQMRLKNMRAVISILAAEGARLGKGEAMPMDWLKENMRPYDVRKMGPAIRAAIAEGMKMEQKEDGTKEKDRVLEELRKKDGQDA